MIVSNNTRLKYDRIISGIIGCNKEFDYNYVTSKPVAVVETRIDGYKFVNGSTKSILQAVSKVPPYGLDQYKNWMSNAVSNTLVNIRQIGANVLSYDCQSAYGIVYYSNGLVYDRRRIYAAFLADNNGNIHVFFNRLEDNIPTNMLRKMMANMYESDFMYVYLYGTRRRVASYAECDMSYIVKPCERTA